MNQCIRGLSLLVITLGALGGTLLQAKTERAPAVLLIPGSGPVDQDGNIPKVYEPALLV